MRGSESKMVVIPTGNDGQRSHRVQNRGLRPAVGEASLDPDLSEEDEELVRRCSRWVSQFLA